MVSFQGGVRADASLSAALGVGSGASPTPKPGAVWGGTQAILETTSQGLCAGWVFTAS